MIPAEMTASGVAALIALGLCSAALLCASIRLVMGPTLGDRVVALDLISMLIVCALVAFAVHAEDHSYLDAALAMALVSFLATVAFARYIDRSPPDAGDGEGDEAERKDPE